MHVVSKSASETQAIAAQLAAKLLATMPAKTATVVALRGELGAGKTTFAQGFARALGVLQTPRSPTFNLVKTYAIPHTKFRLWHVDCYRLDDRTDLAQLDLHTAFADQNNLVLVEWPERIGHGLPRDHVEVHMTHGPHPDARAITLPE